MAGLISGARFLTASVGVGNILATAGVIFALGFAAAEVYEHTAPWGLGQQKTRILKNWGDDMALARANGFRAGAEGQRKLDHDAFEKWGAAVRACESSRTRDSTEATRQLEAARTTGERSRATAYRLGRASCGDSNAKPTTDRSHPVPGGVQHDEDLREVLGAAAYAPSRR